MSNDDERMHPATYNSFARVLDQCISLGPREELLVIHDESFEPYFEEFLHLARDRSLAVTFLFFPKGYQRDLVQRNKVSAGHGRVPLPRAVVGAIAESTAILNLLDGELYTSPVRGAILGQKRQAKSRLAHVPGVTDQLLSIVARTPIQEVHRACELVAWALGECDLAELTTFDSQERSYQLRMGLGGWDNEPFMSPGVILPDTWGNLPPGETFCCPAPEGVDGDVCINGSVPNHRLAPGEEVVLHFEKGRLADWQGKEDSPAVQFLRDEDKKAQARQDTNWRMFAEFGIGLNPAINELFGDSLLDEKAIHTIHIALGDNTCFGHRLDSGIHADLVSIRPNLVCNGELVMEHGDLRLAELERARNDRRGGMSDSQLEGRIRLREGKLAISEGLLKRRLYYDGRDGYVGMADAQTSRYLVELYETLRPFKDVDVQDFLQDCPQIGGIASLELVRLLEHYRAIRINK
jgi:hypothetical protein